VDAEPGFCEVAWRELADFDYREVQVQVDRMTATLLLCADDDLRSDWPETARMIERLVAERVSGQT
jgi:hypothetical protein